MIIPYNEAYGDLPDTADAKRFNMCPIRKDDSRGLIPDFAKAMDWDWVLKHWVKDDRHSKRKLRDVTILVMRESCGMKVATIGKLFGISIGNVSKRATVAREGIRKIVMAMADERDKAEHDPRLVKHAHPKKKDVEQ